MTPDAGPEAGQWRPTDYGFTDGKHQHHCMVTPDVETCDYLNALEARAAQAERERKRLRRTLDATVQLRHQAQQHAERLRVVLNETEAVLSLLRHRQANTDSLG